jgi:hypothetical protein
MHEFTIEIVSDRVARVAGTGDELVAPVGKSIQDSIYEYSQKRAVDAGAPVEVAVHRSGRCTQVTVAPDGTASRSAPTGPIPTSADQGEEPANADMIAEEPVSITLDALGDTAHSAPMTPGRGVRPTPNTMLAANRSLSWRRPESSREQRNRHARGYGGDSTPSWG